MLQTNKQTNKQINKQTNNPKNKAPSPFQCFSSQIIKLINIATAQSVTQPSEVAFFIIFYGEIIIKCIKSFRVLVININNPPNTT